MFSFSPLAVQQVLRLSLPCDLVEPLRPQRNQTKYGFHQSCCNKVIITYLKLLNELVELRLRDVRVVRVAVEHVLRVAHAILSTLVLPAVGCCVLKLFQTSVFSCQQSQGTFIHEVTFLHVTSFPHEIIMSK